MGYFLFTKIMANPAIKNGYVPLANELIEHLATVNIPGQEWRIIMVLLRKTWGWKQDNRRKDWDWISITQFEKATGMKKANVYSSLKSLLVKRIILKQENLLKFNQNYNEWLLVKRLPPLVKSIPAISQLTNKTISQKHNNKINKKTNTKETISKDIDKVSYGNSDINWLLQEFQSIMGFKSAGTKDRFMANHLLKNFNKEQISYMLNYCNSNEYAPRVGSVEKLWFKRGDIIAGIKALNIKSNNQREINI